MKTELTIVVPLMKSNHHLSNELELLGQSLIKFSISAEMVIIAASDRLHLTNLQYEEISSKSLVRVKAITAESNEKKIRLGRLLRLGNSLAESRFVFFLIPEGKYDFSFLPSALIACRRGTPLVIANRFHELNKKSLGASKAFFQQKILRILLGLVRISLPVDVTNSTRLFDKRVFDALAISGNGWDMLAEQTIKTSMVGEKLETIDVVIPTFQNEDDFQLSVLERLFGVLRLLIRSVFHKIGLPWF